MARPIPFSAFLIGGERKFMTFYLENQKLETYNNNEKDIQNEAEIYYRKIKQLPLLEEADIVIPKQKITYANFIEQSFKKRHNPIITEEDLKQVKV